MKPEISRQEERSGTRKLLFGTAIIAIVLLIAVIVWPLIPAPETGNAPTGARDSADKSLGGMGPPAQRQAESTVGKSDPQRPDDDMGGKAQDISRTSQQLSLTPQQQAELRSILAQQNRPQADASHLELMIGAAVPRQVELRDLPQEAVGGMQGYAGAQYTMVRDTLVIMDRQARRVVALVPGMS